MVGALFDPAVFFLKVAGGVAHDFFELAGKIVAVLEAAVEGGFGDVFVGHFEHFDGFHDAQAHQVGQRGLSGDLRECSEKGAARHAGNAGQLVDVDFFHKMFFEVAKCPAELQGLAGVRFLAFGIVAREQGDEDHEVADRHQLISRRPFVQLLFHQGGQGLDFDELVQRQFEMPVVRSPSAQGGFNDEEGLIAWQQAGVELIRIDHLGLVGDVDDSELVGVQIGMRAVSVQDENVSGVAMEILPVYFGCSAAFYHDRDFGKVVSMQRIVSVVDPGEDTQRKSVFTEHIFVISGHHIFHENKCAGISPFFQWFTDGIIVRVFGAAVKFAFDGFAIMNPI